MNHTKCHACGQNIDKREIAIYRSLIESLGKVYRWCKQNNIHEFKMRDIRGVLDHNNYARFGDLVMFGGLVYKLEKARYGLNMERCQVFFNGDSSIPTRIVKDPVTREIEKFDYKTVKQIPGLVTFLDENGLYQPKYVQTKLV